jgi:hypothetical protein
MEPGKKVALELLMEGPGGNLVFRSVQITTGEVKKIAEKEKNPVIISNLAKTAREKNIKVDI